jgi:4,5-dihydroxyphthalate decarboxylase
MEQLFWGKNQTMSKPRVTYAGLLYLDRTRALYDHDVEPDGIDLNYLVFSDVDVLFRRVARHAEFDAAEMSISTYMMMRSRGDDRYIGIPVFLSRQFRHSFIFVNCSKGIDKPQDLTGRQIGIPEYQLSAAVWIRAFLQHDYGLLPSAVHWRCGGLTQPGFIERLPHKLPPNIRVTPIPDDHTLEGDLETGAIDALVSFAVPESLKAGSIKIRRLFADYRAVEADYYRRTRFFPIMHMVVLRRDVYERNRWMAVNLLEGFSEAKKSGLARLYAPGGASAVGIPWLGTILSETDKIFGGDAFPYGYEANREILEAITQYSFEQGLSEQKLDPRALFAPETVDYPGVL